MNQFNDVFVAVKICLKNNEKNEDCFNAVARLADVPPEKLEFYLNTLQDLGLIKYSPKEKIIKLTTFGRKQERLFG